MSVRFDLTAITPELMDAVICMDGSPAYAAFKEEIEAILRDFNEKGNFAGGLQIDEKDLTAKSEDTLKNMHRAFLIWSFAEERKNGADPDCSCMTLTRLFFKSQENTVTALNNDMDTVSCSDAKELIYSFKSEIKSNAAVYESVKEFFKGYVYGYFFNYINEAVIMKKYAEMLAYLGIMSNKIPASVSEQQKILPKMALLLSNDRFKYLNGFVPMSLMLDIVYNRIDFASLSDSETALLLDKISDYIVTRYKTDKEDDIDLLSVDVTASFASDFFGEYVSVPEFAQGLYLKTSSGVRTFLDCDRDDTGDYGAAKLAELINWKCAADHGEFYSSDRDVCNDTSLGGNEMCYKYPLVFKDGGDFWFAPVYEELIYPALDRDMYIPADIPMGMFPFADEAFKTNAVRAAGGISNSAVTIRKDRAAVLEQLVRLSGQTDISERDKKCLCLEQVLCLVSGNCSEAKYRAVFTENVLGSELYETYIRYRMDLLINAAVTGLEAKKVLLDEINRIG